MNRITRTITTAIATGLLIIGAGACTSSDDADPDPTVVDPAGAACLEGDVDCFETGAEGVAVPDPTVVDPAGAACLEGDVDCFETGAEGVADPSAGMCPPGVTDCIDTSTATDSDAP